jgi:hypothetical protein
MRVQKQCQTLIDADSVPRQLSSDDVGFALDDFSYSHRNIPNRNVAVRYTPVAVLRFDGTAGELKYSFANGLAGDRAGMNGHATDHRSAVHNGNVFARLCGRNSALLSSWAATDNDEIVFR